MSSEWAVADGRGGGSGRGADAEAEAAAAMAEAAAAAGLSLDAYKGMLDDKAKKWAALNKKRYTAKHKFGYVEVQVSAPLLPPPRGTAADHRCASTNTARSFTRACLCSCCMLHCTVLQKEDMPPEHLRKIITDHVSGFSESTRRLDVRARY